MTEQAEFPQLHLETLKRGIDKLATRAFLGKPDQTTIQNAEYQVAIPQLRQLYGQIWRWHGTGRLQHTENGIRDVLEGISTNHGLVPHHDPLDPTYGTMESISTTPARTYAFLYAQLHYPKGERLRKVIPTALEWGYYLTIMIRREPRLATSAQFRRDRNLTQVGTAYFHAKYTRASVSNRDMIRHGGLSDILGNYPLLIGIKEGAFEEANLSPILTRHESRSATPIDISNMTHIEVPKKRANEVKEFLKSKGLDITVIPLEWGEEFSKTLPLSYLKDGAPLKND